MADFLDLFRGVLSNPEHVVILICKHLSMTAIINNQIILAFLRPFAEGKKLKKQLGSWNSQENKKAVDAAEFLWVGQV